ncbi:MAG: UDP-N-acetylmuramoyl-tripeptide--D-alanyl-D-alanine ligase [Puia sp.]|nr:UDP-N-acetylmuramoyl-tripeptide--D-alanyl-D-alanine ligase [Puia sp.]
MMIEQLYRLYQQHPSIQTDTRKLKKGDLFFALKGPNFNANLFALEALERGAAYAVVDERPEEGQGLKDRLIYVEDVLQALQALAGYHRSQLNIPFLAITGSNGKTTTKELIHAVLSTTLRTSTTQGNLNNHIGIPLTILAVPVNAEIAVIEMGANHQKEIEGYCRYTRPTHGIITNAGKAHLEGFGGPEGVKKGKGELYQFLREQGGTAFVMWDYDYLREMSAGIPHIISYGTKDAALTGVLKRSEPFLSVDILRGAATGVIPTQLVGDYNLPNVLAAVAVGKYFEVPDDKIATAIAHYTPSNSRSQLIEQGGNHIILDAYNANPSSMRAAIENFASLKAHSKVLILGAMAELGKESLAEHLGIVELIGRYPWSQVALVGGDFQKIDHPYLHFTDSKEAARWMKNAQLQDQYILIKGSRSTKMEQVLEG